MDFLQSVYEIRRGWQRFSATPLEGLMVFPGPFEVWSKRLGPVSVPIPTPTRISKQKYPMKVGP